MGDIFGSDLLRRNVKQWTNFICISVYTSRWLFQRGYICVTYKLYTVTEYSRPLLIQSLSTDGRILLQRTPIRTHERLQPRPEDVFVWPLFSVSPAVVPKLFLYRLPVSIKPGEKSRRSRSDRLDSGASCHRYFTIVCMYYSITVPLLRLERRQSNQFRTLSRRRIIPRHLPAL